MGCKPELRFTEFTDEWEEKRLGNLGNFKNGINKSKEDFGKGYPFINLMDLFGKNSIYNSKFDLVNVNEKELEEYCLKQGDVLFIRSSVKREGVGLTAVIMENLENTVYSGFIIRFRELSEFFNLNFKKYCFYTSKFRNSLISKSSTSANTNINQQSLNTLKIIFPSLEEQDKIANFLSNLDEKIYLLEEKLVKWNLYKKGIIQQIFSQELRFKDRFGENYSDWAEINLGNLVNIQKGTQLNKDDMIDDGRYYVLNGGIEPSGFTNNWNTEENTITISEGGNSCGYVNFNIEKFWSGGHCYSLTEIDECTNKLFLFQVLKSNEINIMRLRVGSGLPNIQKKDLNKFKILLPVLKEQEKIAKFLCNVDTKICGFENKLEKANKFKKGLLQKMFC